MFLEPLVINTFFLWRARFENHSYFVWIWKVASETSLFKLSNATSMWLYYCFLKLGASVCYSFTIYTVTIIFNQLFYYEIVGKDVFSIQALNGSLLFSQVSQKVPVHGLCVFIRVQTLDTEKRIITISTNLEFLSNLQNITLVDLEFTKNFSVTDL